MNFRSYFLLFFLILKCTDARFLVTSGEEPKTRNVERRNMIGSMSKSEPEKKSVYGVIEVGNTHESKKPDANPTNELDPDNLEELAHKIGQLMLNTEKHKHNHAPLVPRHKSHRKSEKASKFRSENKSQVEKLAEDLLKAERSRGKRNSGPDGVKNEKGTLVDREAALERVLDPIQNADSALEEHDRQKRNL